MLILTNCSSLNRSLTISKQKKHEEIKVPDYVPESKRQAFRNLIIRAKEYSSVLRADPKIADVLTKKDHIILRTKRDWLETDILIYGLDLKSYKVENNRFKIIQKRPKMDLGEKFKYGSIGFGSGVLFTGGIFLLVLFL